MTSQEAKMQALAISVVKAEDFGEMLDAINLYIQAKEKENNPSNYVY